MRIFKGFEASIGWFQLRILHLQGRLPREYPMG